MTFGVSPNPERRQRNRALTAVMDDSAMALTAEEHVQLAAAYEKAAGDCLIPLEQQAAFARKAKLCAHTRSISGKERAGGSPSHHAAGALKAK
jgi:hypothetical protein